LLTESTQVTNADGSDCIVSTGFYHTAYSSDSQLILITGSQFQFSQNAGFKIMEVQLHEPYYL